MKKKKIYNCNNSHNDNENDSKKLHGLVPSIFLFFVGLAGIRLDVSLVDEHYCVTRLF